MQTRREFLRYMTALAGTAGFLPQAVQRAYAIKADPGSTYMDAEHVVILMQENRSFDHAFGTLRGVRGFRDPRALRLANGKPVYVQTDAAGNSYAPWRLDIRDTRITWMGSLAHSRESQVDAWNEGLHDQWLPAKRDHNYPHMPLTMGYYTRADLPFYYALADAFTICDQHYCSVLTSTSPNRSYFWSGTIREQQDAAARAHIRNEQIDYGGLTWKTFPERLQAAGISWKAYQNELTRSPLTGEEDAWLSNFGDNVLECFQAYNPQACAGFPAAAERWRSEMEAGAKKLETRLSASKDDREKASLGRQLSALHAQMASMTVAIKDGGAAAYAHLSAQDKALHDAAFVTNTGDPHYHSLASLSYEADGQQKTLAVPRGDVLHQFRKDVQEGTLPAVSWLTASERFSDHPSSAWFGAWYISEVMDILTSNPEVWKKTIFLLTYDENDGYFDHAPSFVAADPRRPETGGASAGIDTGLEYIYQDDERAMGVAEEEARSGPIGMGFRVPLIIASPWTRGGWVNSQLFDHTSTLMFLEKFVQQKYGKPVREENISAWRRTVSGDLTSAFRPDPAHLAPLASVARDPFVVSIAQARDRALPSSYRKLEDGETFVPDQEPGTRPSCALPYEFYADAVFTGDGQKCGLRLRVGEASQGVPLNVYLRNLQAGGEAKMRAATYTVSTGDSLSIDYPASLFADGRWHLEVIGPNGFYRSYQATGPQPVEVRMGHERNGDAVLHLRNNDGQSRTLTVKDNAYHAPLVTKTLAEHLQASVALPLGKNHGWYDFTVTVTDAYYAARFAGRVENGQPGISDPAMAGLNLS